MKGWSSKQEISQMKKELEKSHNEMLEGIKEKVIKFIHWFICNVYINE